MVWKTSLSARARWARSEREGPSGVSSALEYSMATWAAHRKTRFFAPFEAFASAEL